MEREEGGQGQGLWEPAASAPVALSCPHGVEVTALQEAGGLGVIHREGEGTRLE